MRLTERTCNVGKGETKQTGLTTEKQEWWASDEIDWLNDMPPYNKESYFQRHPEDLKFLLTEEKQQNEMTTGNKSYRRSFKKGKRGKK